MTKGWGEVKAGDVLGGHTFGSRGESMIACATCRRPISEHTINADREYVCPTNDPTAPRVVGPKAWPTCKDGAPCSYSRQMDQPYPRHCLRCGQPEPAVLPEEGTTPPRCTFCGSAKHVVADCTLPGAWEFGGKPYRGAGPLRETGAGRGEASDLLRYEINAQITPPAPDLAKLQAEVRSLWEIVRQKERDAYQGANALDVQELDALNTQLALENADLRARLAASPEGGAPTGTQPERHAFLAGYLTGRSERNEWNGEDSERRRGEVLAVEYAEAAYRASRLTRSPRAAGEPSDTERLDWLDAQPDVVVARGEWSDMTTQTSVCSEGDAPRLPFVHAPTTREAIDAAMRPAAPPPSPLP